MNIIPASTTILTQTPEETFLHNVEVAGRSCYQSFDYMTEGSAKRFTRMILEKGHEAMIEHAGVITVRFIVDRGISHEIVRSRVGTSFAQESTRYCNYSKGKFGGVTFIDPRPMLNSQHSPMVAMNLFNMWKASIAKAEEAYLQMIRFGATPQEARSVLPTSVKTDLVVTANLRAWRYFFRLRALEEAGKAHPQMLEVTIPLLQDFKDRWPTFFGDLL